MNNDGQADILFENVSTGKLYVWYMHADTLIAGGYLNPDNPGIGWYGAGLADINGDGRPEILFQNASTGQMAYWMMNGRNLASVGFPNPAFPGGTGWKLAGAH
jgi:hypothetical protein